jgi:drug/metabolite transporter, DME family
MSLPSLESQPASHSPVRSRLLLLAAAVLFSTGGAAIKSCSLSAMQLASFRSGIAALSLAVLLPEARQRWTWRTVAVGCAYSATLMLFVMANKTTTSANAIFLQATAPVYLLFLGPLLLREPVRRSHLLVIASVACGAALMFLGAPAASATAPDPARGNLYAAASGLTWALTVSGLRWLERDADAVGSAITTVVCGNLIAFLLCLPAALPVTRFSFSDAATLLYLGVFQIGLAYFALTRSIRHVPALEASTLLMAEPALNPFWTWLIHRERPGLAPFVGGVLVLAATMAGTWWNGRRTSRPGQFK